MQAEPRMSMSKKGRPLYEYLFWVLMVGFTVQISLGFYTCVYVHNAMKCERSEDKTKLKEGVQAIAKTTPKEIADQREKAPITVKLSASGSDRDYNDADKQNSAESGQFTFSHGMNTYEIKWVAGGKECEVTKNNNSMLSGERVTVYQSKLNNLAASVLKDDDKIKDILTSDFNTFNQKAVIGSMLLVSSI